MDTFLKPIETVSRSQIVSLPEKPKMVGHFSIDYPFEPSQIRLDASNCKYFRKQMTHDCLIDLREFDTFRNDYENSTNHQYKFSRMTILLEYLKRLILKEEFMRHSDKQIFSSDIICDKRFFHKVLRAPGDSQPGQKFVFLCTKYKGNIYIVEHQPKNVPRNYDNILSRHVLCTGKKNNRSLCVHLPYLFNKLIKLDKPQSDINSSIPGAAKFFGLFNMKLKDISLMYCGCIRGVISETEVNETTDFNQVKKGDVFLHKRFEPLSSAIFSKYVTPSWWSQLFLHGCDYMYLAEFRDYDTIDSVEKITTSDLVHKYKVVIALSWSLFFFIKIQFRLQKKWLKSSKERMSFLNLLVEFINLRMTFIDCPHTVYRFEYSPQINKSIQYSVYKGRNEFTFLPDEYVNLLKEL